MASLNVTDNVPGSPHTVSLSGTGQDFSLASSGSSTANITAGQSATYTVVVNPAGGFNQAVALSCSGAPAQSTCLLSSSSVKLNGSSATSVKVTVTTAGNSASLTSPFDFPTLNGGFMLAVALPGLSGLVLLGGLASHRKKRGLTFYGLGTLCLLVIIWSACGSSNPGNQGNVTPSGTYDLTVNGTFSTGSTNLTHTAKLTLVVK